MKKETFKELSRAELFFFQSEVMSRTPVDTELQEQIYQELKRRKEEKREDGRK